MDLVSRRFGNPDGQAIVLLAGFGDNGSAYDGFADTVLVDDYELIAADLPGFGNTESESQPLDLERAAQLVANVIVENDARIIMGHSLGSIIASLAASTTAPQVLTIISIEGNLTPQDAYFSGSAALYATPEQFRTEFLARLDELAKESDVVLRYRNEVARADPQSLWELGCDAHRFSSTRSPGELLQNAAPQVHYIYNPANTPPETISWLEDHPNLPRSELPGASHWMMVDQPQLLAQLIACILDGTAPESPI